MKDFLKRPAVFHGLMAGLVLLAVKLVFAFTGNWSYRLQPTYSVFAFLAVVLAVVLSGVAERRLRNEVSYGSALLRAMLTISILVFVSLLGDQIAYRTKPGLAENAKTFQLESASQNLNVVSFISESSKEKILEVLENTDSKEFYSIPTLIRSWISYVLLNAIWALVVVIFLRKTRDPLKEDLLE